MADTSNDERYNSSLALTPFFPSSPHDDRTAADTANSTLPAPLTVGQILDLSVTFKEKYKVYHTLHTQLADRTVAPTEEEQAEIWKLHEEVVEMKRVINEGVARLGPGAGEEAGGVWKREEREVKELRGREGGDGPLDEAAANKGGGSANIPA